MEEITKTIPKEVLGDYLYKTSINYFSIEFFKRCNSKNIKGKSSSKNKIIQEEDPHPDKKKISYTQLNEQQIIYNMYGITPEFCKMFNTDVYPFWLEEKKRLSAATAAAATASSSSSIPPSWSNKEFKSFTNAPVFKRITL